MLYNYFLDMSNKYLKVMMFIQENLIRKASSSRIFFSINNKPVQIEYQNPTAQAVKFVEQQMEQYNFSKSVPRSSKRQIVIKSKIDERVKKDATIRLAKIALKLQKELTYLELESLSELLTQMSIKQRQINKRNLQMISRNLIKESHVLESAKKIIEQIRAVLSKKSRQIS